MLGPLSNEKVKRRIFFFFGRTSPSRPWTYLENGGRAYFKLTSHPIGLRLVFATSAISSQSLFATSARSLTRTLPR